MFGNAGYRGDAMRTSAILRGFVVALLVSPGCTCQKSASLEKGDASDAAATPLAAGTVTASDLLGEYEANRARADAKYRGKRLRVSGTVASVTDNGASAGDAYVTLAAGAGADAEAAPLPTGLRCYFADARQAAALAKGVKLTVECDVDNSATAVVLRRCAFGAV